MLNASFLSGSETICMLVSKSENVVSVEFNTELDHLPRAWDTVIDNEGSNLPTYKKWTVKDSIYYNLGKMLFEHKFKNQQGL